MSTTAADIITAAFRKAGIETPTTTQRTDALTTLNNMVSGWTPEIIQVAVTRESLALTAGTASYTIGPAGDLATVRPLRLENAFLRDSESLDSPLEIIAAKDYNQVASKTIEARPSALYFIPSETAATIIFDCEPDAAYTLYIESWKPFTEFTALTTAVSLPVEYKEALIYNLAVCLAEDWDRILPRTVYERAKEIKYLLSNATAASRPAPKARFDFANRGGWMIETDTWR